MVENKVSVVILNWNSVDMLGECIESVKRQTYPEIELWIIDNASTDGSVKYLQMNYPDIYLVTFTENLGFSKAHNYGIRQTDGAYYMPLNPDVILTPTYITEMVKAMQLNKDVGSVAGKLLFMDQDHQRTDIFYSTGHLLTKSRSPTNRGYKQQDKGQYDNVELVFAANGAAPLYRRAMLEDIAINSEYFCEDFFIYGEDHDLGWRAQLGGWKCIYTPDAIGCHVGFGSQGIRNFRVQVQFTRNRYLTLVRNDRFLHFLFDIPYVIVYEIIWQLSRLLLSPRRLPAHWWGLLQCVFALPTGLKARAIIQKKVRVTEEYIRSFFVSQLW